MKFVDKWVANYIKKRQKEQVKQLEDTKEENELTFYNNLKTLYSFVKWLNTKGLKNRVERRAFWKNVNKGKPTLETTIRNLLIDYTNRVTPAPKATKKDEKLITKERK